MQGPQHDDPARHARQLSSGVTSSWGTRHLRPSHAATPHRGRKPWFLVRGSVVNRLTTGEGPGRPSKRVTHYSLPEMMARAVIRAQRLESARRLQENPRKTKAFPLRRYQERAVDAHFDAQRLGATS